MRMDEIVRRNEQAGHYFFSEGAMRFFRSRVHSTVYGGRFFVTSEKPPYGPRCYSVRFAEDDGSITDVAGFMRYASASGAHKAAERYASLHAAGKWPAAQVTKEDEAA